MSDPVTDAGCSLLRLSRWHVGVIVSLTVFPAIAGYAQGPSGAPACPAITQHTEIPADTAYAQGQLKQAEDQYSLALVQQPQDERLSAMLVRTLLRENQFDKAAAQAAKGLEQTPKSAVALTALAEAQYRQGQPWLAMETLEKALAADGCYPRAYLVRSRLDRINSMYGSEREDVRKANAIDPQDPEIHHAFASVVAAADQIDGSQKALETMKDLDAETRQKVLGSIADLLPLLSETTQTCKVLPAEPSATLKLLPMMDDAKHVGGHQIEVQLPQTKAKLQMDTGASGLFISKALADQNGLHATPEDMPGTMHVESVKIGPLEFRNCVVGVSETPFAGTDGFIGTDIFSQYLVTIDYSQARLELAPLPPAPKIPGDRVKAPELAGFVPIYHRQQYLLVPVTLNDKTRRLFTINTAMRFTTMASDVAHSVSTTKVNFTNAAETASGSTLQIYRDGFDFQLASLGPVHAKHVLQFDMAPTSRNAGFSVAGMLGFDMLHLMTLRLDYRDGLVKFEPTDQTLAPAQSKGVMTASAEAAPECPSTDTMVIPSSSAIEARVTGLLDAGRLKAGKEITAKVVNGWAINECTLAENAFLYGHVTAAASSKDASGSELAMVFDKADCSGHPGKAMKLLLVAAIGPPENVQSVHNAMPSEVGGTRNISAVASSMGIMFDENMNPNGPPHTVQAGFVLGLPQIKLEPTGGPACSARMSSAAHNVMLAPGSEFILAAMVTH